MNKKLIWLGIVFLFLIPIVYAADYRDYDTFTRTNTTALGKTEGIGTGYTAYGSPMTIVDNKANLSSTGQVGSIFTDTATHNWATWFFKINVTVGKQFAITLEDNTGSTSYVAARMNKSGALEYSPTNDIGGASFPSTGVKFKQGEFYWVGLFANASNDKFDIYVYNTTGANLYNATGVAITTSPLSNIARFRYIYISTGELNGGASSMIDEWYMCDDTNGVNLTCHPPFDVEAPPPEAINYSVYINESNLYSITNMTDSSLLGFCKGSIDSGNNIDKYYYSWYRDGKLNTSGLVYYNFTNISVCSQEYSNKTTTCWGISGGNYTQVINSEWVDGDYNTGVVATNEVLRIEYVIPSVNNNSFWVTKDAIGTNLINVPSVCLMNRTLKFDIYIGSTTNYYCWNVNSTTQQILSRATPGKTFYEESIIWYKDYPLSTINATAGMVGNWTFSCLASNTSINSSWNNLTRDITGFIAPTITINSNTFFSTNNNTFINNLTSTSALLNVTFTDDYDLFAYEVIVKNSAGSVTYNFTNSSLTGAASRLISKNLAVNGSEGLYSITINVSDTHTLNEIGTYNVKEGKDYLEFNSQIKITAEGAIDSNTIKEVDRYNFAFVYGEKEITNKVFYLESNHELVYLPDSKYKGHFIDWINKKWIDFEGEEGDIAVTKITSNKYKIEIINSEKEVLFNSIGGINTNSVTYYYYLLNPPIVNYIVPNQASNNLTNSSITIIINVTGNFQNYTTINLYNLTSLVNSTNLTYSGNGSYLYNITFNLNNVTVHKFYINATTTDKVNNVVTSTLGTTKLLTYREIDIPTITFNATITDDVNYPLNITVTMKCVNKYEPFLNYTFSLNGAYFIQGYNRTNGTIISNSSTMNVSLSTVKGYCWSEYGSVNASQNFGIVNVVFKKETTDEIVTDDNMTMEIFGEDNGVRKYFGNITGGNMTLFFSESDLYTFRYFGDKFYDEKFRFLEYDQNLSYNLTLYVIDNSSTTQVKVTVLDQNGDFVEDATVKLYKYDFVTNSYILVEEGLTNFEGETRLYVELGKEFYKFLVYHGGELKKETSPTYVYDTTLNIYIDLSTGGGEHWENVADVSATLEFQESDNRFKAIYDDNGETISRACLDVYRDSGNSRTLWNQSCSTSYSSILYSGITNVSGRNYLAQVIITIDGQETVVTELWYRYDEGEKEKFGKSGLFVLLIFTMTAIGIGAMFRASVAIILAPIPLLLMSVTHIVTISYGICIGLEVIAIIIAGLLEAKRYG